jgi:hypothetical protein
VARKEKEERIEGIYKNINNPIRVHIGNLKKLGGRCMKRGEAGGVASRI